MLLDDSFQSIKYFCLVLVWELLYVSSRSSRDLGGIYFWKL